MLRLLRNTLASVLLVGLMASSASAQTSLDSIWQYRSATLRMLGLDTTGNSFVTTADVDKMIGLAVNQLPNWVWGEEKVKNILVAKDSGVSGDAYYVDSNVAQIIWVVKHDKDTLRTLKQRGPPTWNDDYPKGESQPSNFRPTSYTFFADTMYVYPSPKSTSVDTLRVAYYQAASIDSIWGSGLVTLDKRFQLGVVYHVAYQILVSTAPMGDWKGAWERYMAWVAATKANTIGRPTDLLKDEKRQ